MAAERYPRLWEPIRVGGRALRNRVVMGALGTAFAHPDGSVSPRLIAFLERRARGGVGLVVTEATAVDGSGVPFPGVPRADDDRYVDGLSALARVVRAHGAAAALQLYHPGRQMSVRVSGAEPVAPSAVACPAVRETPRALAPDEIEALVDRFAAAAGRARAAGFDAVELNAGHGYLIHQFLSPLANRRDDAWGGDPDRRRRFAVEVVRRVRARVGPGFPILCKLSAEERLPGGLALADGVETARALAAAGADAIVASAGTYASFEWLVQPSLWPPGCLRACAAALRRAVTVPVAAVGRITHPALAEELLARGEADLVVLGRALLADPDWPARARSGRPDGIRPCIACNQCLRRLFGPEPINCSVNPEAGRESEGWPGPRARRRLVVVGGGVAGMTAAVLAAEQGHVVTLLEAAGELGGRLRAAARVPYRVEMGRLAGHLAVRLEEVGVEVRLRCRATPEMVATLRPDVVIRATGGRPGTRLPPVAEGTRVELADECLLALAPGTGSAVVVGDTAVAVEVAECLHDAGHRVTLLCPVGRAAIAREAETVTRRALLAALARRGLEVIYEAEVERIAGGRAHYRTRDGRQGSLPARRLVLAHGLEADGGPDDAVAPAGVPVHRVGDCLTPGGILGATQSAVEVVRTLAS